MKSSCELSSFDPEQFLVGRGLGTLENMALLKKHPQHAHELAMGIVRLGMIKPERFDTPENIALLDKHPQNVGNIVFLFHIINKAKLGNKPQNTDLIAQHTEFALDIGKALDQLIKFGIHSQENFIALFLYPEYVKNITDQEINGHILDQANFKAIMSSNRVMREQCDRRKAAITDALGPLSPSLFGRKKEIASPVVPEQLSGIIFDYLGTLGMKGG